MLAESFEKYLKAGSGQAFLKKRLIVRGRMAAVEVYEAEGASTSAK